MSYFHGIVDSNCDRIGGILAPLAGICPIGIGIACLSWFFCFQSLPQGRAESLAVCHCEQENSEPKPSTQQGESAARFPGLIQEEFVFETAPFPSCHASTICDSGGVLIAAWFGGTREKHPDVGIWLSRFVDGKWSEPVEVATGVQDESKRLPCWNPVLFQVPDQPLTLFYKVGPSPSTWWGMMKQSSDHGATWSEPTRLPDNILGPIKNKPIFLKEKLICGSSSEHAGWRVHFEIAEPSLENWKRIGPINDGKEFSAIQPTLLVYNESKIQALCRSGQDVILESWSEDMGATWTPLKATSLPNPNAGIDGITLSDGTQLLVYNHTIESGNRPREREMLNLAWSENGRDWQACAILEESSGEFSYPAIIQSADGLVHITYTHQRKKIKHLVVDPKRLNKTPMIDGVWPRPESKR
jgi:predicted neuraminidase